MSDIRQAAFDIVHRLRNAQTQVAIYKELKRAGSTFGYDAFLIGGLPHTPHDNLYDCWLISGWPSAWAQRYQDKRYLYCDPVIGHIRTSVDPFAWQDAAEARADTRGAVVMDEACDFGLREGFCVPFHEIDGGEAGVSFGGSRVRLSEDERAGLHLVALYAMSTAKALAQPKDPPARGRRPNAPTQRETECLKWSAAGKTAWEISSILSISERTVEQHLASAARRLNAVTRVQSVAEALRRGIID